MKKRAPYILIGFLLLIAVILGYEIYAKLFNPNISIITIILSKNSQPQSIKKENTSTDDLSFLIQANISELNEQESQKLRNLLAKEAKTGNSITLTNACQVNPLVLGLDESNQITIKNSDKSTHTITFIDQIATISAGQSAIINAPPLNPESIFRYGCDYKPSGYIIKN